MNQISEQQSRLKQLISRGKEQGYLTYAEVNDHLPDSIVDPEQVEDIINMINDMGISVREKAPEADTFILTDDNVESNDEAAEEAAAALASVEAEFGRTTDPVRMYMREMGTVELLTREGEISIAKRIEEGLLQVKLSLAQFPLAIELLLEEWDKVLAEEARLTDVMVNFFDPDADDTPPPPVIPTAKTADNDKRDEEAEAIDTGPDPEEAAERFATIRKLHKEIKSARARGHSKKLETAEESMRHALARIKFTPRITLAMVTTLHDTVGRLRYLEREIMRICTNRCKMPRRDFIKTFPENETKLEWLDQYINSDHAYAEALKEHSEAIIDLQKLLQKIEAETTLSISTIKSINRSMSIGEAKARRAKKEMVEEVNRDIGSRESARSGHLYPYGR